MLRVLKNGRDQWCDFYQYDNATADLILHARPSAVNGYSEAYADLVNGGAYLNANAGLFLLYQYHGPTGYLTATLIQKGWLGTPILLRQYEYTACIPSGSSSSSSASSSRSSGSSSSGAPGTAPPVYRLAREIKYPDVQSSSSSSPSSLSGALRKIITSHAYTFYSGTCQVQQHTITLAVISTAQNGSGVANTRREYFAILVNMTWIMNYRGFITRNT